MNAIPQPPSSSQPDPERLADRLHSAAIHLLRALRVQDDALGLSAPRLSALSVLVFGGERRIGELAAVEQVTPATMSRLVAALEDEGHVERGRDPDDGRAWIVAATPAGREVLAEGRRRRVGALARALARLEADEREHLERTLATVEEVLGHLADT